MGDLTALRRMHPLLPPEKCEYFELKAAHGLQRRGHKPETPLPVAISDQDWGCALRWRERPVSSATALDPKRITELGAEAIALAIVKDAKGWTVRARMREGQFADWLLVDGQGRRIALEISGCASQNRYRLKRKLAQVAKVKYADLRVACVVEFGPPRAYLAEAGGMPL